MCESLKLSNQKKLAWIGLTLYFSQENVTAANFCITNVHLQAMNGQVLRPLI